MGGGRQVGDLGNGEVSPLSVARPSLKGTGFAVPTPAQLHGSAFRRWGEFVWIEIVPGAGWAKLSSAAEAAWLGGLAWHPFGCAQDRL